MSLEDGSGIMSRLHRASQSSGGPSHVGLRCGPGPRVPRGSSLFHRSCLLCPHWTLCTDPCGRSFDSSYARFLDAFRRGEGARHTLFCWPSLDSSCGPSLGVRGDARTSLRCSTSYHSCPTSWGAGGRMSLTQPSAPASLGGGASPRVRSRRVHSRQGGSSRGEGGRAGTGHTSADVSGSIIGVHHPGRCLPSLQQSSPRRASRRTWPLRPSIRLPLFLSQTSRRSSLGPPLRWMLSAYCGPCDVLLGRALGVRPAGPLTTCGRSWGRMRRPPQGLLPSCSGSSMEMCLPLSVRHCWLLA